MPKIKSLSTDPNTFKVNAGYTRSLPLTLTNKQAFYSEDRFSNPRFKNLFDAGTLYYQPPTVDGPTDGRVDLYEKNTSFSVFSTEAHAGFVFGAPGGAGQIDAGIDGIYGRAKASIHILRIVKVRELTPPETPTGDYYLSSVILGQSCRLILNFTESRFSNQLNGKIAIDAIVDGDISAELKHNITSAAGKLITTRKVTFTLSDDLDESIREVNIGNFCEKIPEILKHLDRECRVAARARAEVIGGTYTRYPHPDPRNGIGCLSSIAYIMAILSYRHKYYEYYGDEYATRLIDNDRAAYLIHTAMRLSRPVETDDLLTSSAEVRRLASEGDDCITTRMRALDRENYIVSGDFVTIDFRTGGEIDEYYPLRDSANIMEGVVRCKSSLAPWYAKIAFAFPAAGYPFMQSAWLRKFGILCVLAEKCDFWGHVRKRNDSLHSHVIQSHEYTELSVGLGPREEDPLMESEFTYELVRVSDSATGTMSPLEAAPEAPPTAHAHPPFSLSSSFTVKTGDNKFLLKSGEGRAPTPRYANCARFFFSRHEFKGRPSVVGLENELRRISLPRR